MSLLPLAGCGAQIDHHGHVFIDVDLQQVQPGMTKEQVTQAFGSPDTTSTIGGDAYYYISSTQKTYAFFKPWEIDRQVVAIYFGPTDNVQQVAHYGMKQVQVLDKSGKLIRRYPGGNMTTSNVAFGGPKHDQLFVTGGLGGESGAGGVFRLDLGVKGLVILPK